ncbi:MAG: hypothetical protein V4450_06850 [Bacteroidota bacterium]
MKRLSILQWFFFLLFYVPAIAQKNDSPTNAFKDLIEYFLANKQISKTGNILPYPGLFYTDQKPFMLHIEIKPQFKKAVIELLQKTEDRKITTLLGNIDMNVQSISKKLAVDSNPKIYNDTTKHIIGTLTLLGVYAKKDKYNRITDIYFDTIRRSSLTSKSQFNDVIKMSYSGTKWVYKKTISFSKS